MKNPIQPSFGNVQVCLHCGHAQHWLIGTSYSDLAIAQLYMSFKLLRVSKMLFITVKLI